MRLLYAIFILLVLIWLKIDINSLIWFFLMLFWPLLAPIQPIVTSLSPLFILIILPYGMILALWRLTNGAKR